MICWTVLWHIVLHSGGFGLDLAVLLIRAVFSLEHLSQVDVMILYSFFCNSPFTLRLVYFCSIKVSGGMCSQGHSWGRSFSTHGLYLLPLLILLLLSLHKSCYNYGHYRLTFIPPAILYCTSTLSKKQYDSERKLPHTASVLTLYNVGISVGICLGFYTTKTLIN